MRMTLKQKAGNLFKKAQDILEMKEIHYFEINKLEKKNRKFCFFFSQFFFGPDHDCHNKIARSIMNNYNMRP